MNAFGHLNLPELQKKWKNNPQLAVGASAVVGVFGIAYLIKRLSSSKDDESHIPDFALPNDDRDLTKRLANIRNRRQARKQKKQNSKRNKQHNSKNGEKSNKNKKNNTNDNKNNPNLTTNENGLNEQNDDDYENNEHDGKNRNELNKNNDENDGNYSNSNENENENVNENESDNDDGYHADEYYNPRLKIKRGSLQRKPDAAFMSLFALYASNTEENNSTSGLHSLDHISQSNYNEPPFPQNFQSNVNLGDAPSTTSFESKEAQDVDQLSSHGGMSVNNDMSMNNGNIGMENDMNGATMNAANIASHNSNQNDYRFDNSNRTPINTLDRLKDLYARNKLPPSLQPNSLSMSFQSNPKQAAIVNRNNDSIMSTLKQMM